MTNEGSWHILTGEYPPDPGGVSDYSWLLAGDLAAAGIQVHVWTRSDQGVTTDGRGVTVHRTAGRWSRSDLAGIGAALDGLAPPRRLLVQYTPNQWGYKGLNFGFCRWLVRRRERGDDVRLMFHEVLYPLQLWDRPTRWFLAASHPWMARTLLRASSSVYVSTPYWERLLRGCDPGHRREITWLPVPSNVPVLDDAAGVAGLRRRIASRGQTVLGSFGTFAGRTASLLETIVPPLLAGRPDRLGVLIGRGGDRFAARMVEAHPELAGRLVATGGLPAVEASRHLQVCDLLVQPYPDGATARRGSLMAGLAHGVATASTLGGLSEPIWAETGCLALAPADDPAALVRVAEAVLASPAARARLGALGRRVYAEHFSWERTVATLVGPEPVLG